MSSLEWNEFVILVILQSTNEGFPEIVNHNSTFLGFDFDDE